MDPREKANNPLTSLLLAFEGWQSAMWTALPGIVQSFDPTKRTCVVRSALKMSKQLPDLTWEWEEIPLLLDCPVFFPSGGGCTLTFPITAGDECLVVFSARCIDSWWDTGDVSTQFEPRMHDLSDGFCFVGFNSKPKVIGAISTTAVELRTDDGQAKISVDPDTKDIHAETTGDFNVDAANINLNGVLTINGLPYLAHTHSGVTTGPSDTGGVA
jgi:hypothetical protein